MLIKINLSFIKCVEDALKFLTSCKIHVHNLEVGLKIQSSHDIIRRYLWWIIIVARAICMKVTDIPGLWIRNTCQGWNQILQQADVLEQCHACDCSCDQATWERNAIINEHVQNECLMGSNSNLQDSSATDQNTYACPPCAAAPNGSVRLVTGRVMWLSASRRTKKRSMPVNGGRRNTGPDIILWEE